MPYIKNMLWVRNVERLNERSIWVEVIRTWKIMLQRYILMQSCCYNLIIYEISWKSNWKKSKLKTWKNSQSNKSQSKKSKVEISITQHLATISRIPMHDIEYYCIWISKVSKPFEIQFQYMNVNYYTTCHVHVAHK